MTAGAMSKWERCRDRKVVTLALKVAIVVGTIVNVINQFDLLAFGAPLTRLKMIQIALTYLVPYCVSTHGQVFGRRS